MSRIPPLLAVLSLAAPLLAAEPDSVTVRGGKGEMKGIIEKEGAEGITFKSGGASKDIPAKDIESLAHGDAPAEYRQAEEAEQGADYARAAELYLKAAAGKGRAWLAHDSLFHRADCLYHLGNLKDALAGLKELSEKAPEGRFKSMAQVRLGQCHLFLKAYPEAEAAFKALRNPKRNWEDAAGAYWLGRLAEAQGDPASARRAYEDVGLMTVPDVKAMAKARLAVCDAVEGKASRETLKALQELAEANPSDRAAGAALQNALGQVGLALARAAKGDEAAALAFDGAMAFSHVIVLGEAFSEEHAAAYSGAAQCFALLKDEAKAAQCRDDLKRFYGDAFPGVR